MAAVTVSPEQQIQHVQDVLARLRRTAPFRGQSDVISDVEAHLTYLLDAMALGELPPISIGKTNPTARPTKRR